jgi:type IV pilus assembly protein PilM
MKERITTGIDFGKSSVKIIKLKELNNIYKLIAYGTFSLVDQEKLKEFILINKLATGDIRVNINDSSIKIKHVSLPQIPDEEINEAIKWQLKDELGDNIDNWIFRYLKSEENFIPGRISFSVYCVLKEILLNRIMLLNEFKIKPQIIEPNAQAISLIFNKTKEKKSSFFFEMGEEISHFMLIKNEHILFIRSIIDISGSALTQSISRDLNITEEKAENLKKNYIEEETQDKEKNLLKNSISNYLSRLVLELQRSIDAANLMYPDEHSNLNELYISGASACLSGFKNYLSKTLGIKVEIFNPFEAIDTSSFPDNNLKEKALYYTVACGLAL